MSKYFFCTFAIQILIFLILTQEFQLRLLPEQAASEQAIADYCRILRNGKFLNLTLHRNLDRQIED